MLQKILFTSNLFCIFAYDTIKYILETWQLKNLSASLSTSNHILQKKKWFYDDCYENYWRVEISCGMNRSHRDEHELYASWMAI